MRVGHAWFYCGKRTAPADVPLAELEEYAGRMLRLEWDENTPAAYLELTEEIEKRRCSVVP